MLVTPKLDSVLNGRTVSSFPLSIGTALAFESLFEGTLPVYDEGRLIPERIDTSKYDEFHINMATLIRNILGSVSTGVRDRITIDEIAVTLIEEVAFIDDLVKTATNSKLKVVFYWNQYRDLQKKYPNAKIRVPTTIPQIEYEQHQEAVLKHMLSLSEGFQSEGITVKTVELEPEPIKSSSRALIITHCAFDLLAAGRFAKLDLLESHTGVLKTRALWYTKLQDGKKLPNIPFNDCTLQIFGDSQTFHPMPIAERRAVVEIAEQFHWNALTTKDRLRLGFDLMKDRVLAAKLKSLLVS